ncbi:MAG: DUF1844 domain-containing protein [Desulfobacteraceae bacterium]|nr:MAG: DUF1844 domain-containing protein [Desulfobacteraceae bacterium]
MAEENNAGMKAPTGAEQQAAAEKADSKAKQQKHYNLPKIDFATFVLSINSSALVQLGLIEDPATGQKATNFSLAKQTIDLLDMLEEKTRGNLNADEDNILKNILYELRMLYVKEKK